jgi:hypothetical protein
VTEANGGGQIVNVLSLLSLRACMSECEAALDAE